MFRKISKIARFILLLILFLTGLVYIVFRSQPVQTWIVHQVTDFLSEELNTKLKISSVDIDLFKTANLENVYIEDLNGDTLFYFRKIQIDYNTYSQNQKKILLNYVGFQNGKIYFGTHKGEENPNYEFFINYFDAGPRDPNKPKTIWTIYSKRVEFLNNRFDYFDKNSEKPDFMDFDYNHISFREITGNITDFYLIDDSLNFNILHLQTKEKCGLDILHLTAIANIHAKGISFDSLTAYTPNSLISNRFAMITENWKTYNNFYDKVKMEANLVKSEINTKDLSYFSHYIKNYNTSIFINGKSSGVLSNLKGFNNQIECFEQTFISANWHLKGLPNIENTIFDIDIKKLNTNIEDIEKISLAKLPKEVHQLEKFSFEGNFNGFYNDFVTFGNFITDLGNIQSDLQLNYKNGLENAIYSGKITTNDFKFKTLFPESNIDNISLSTSIKGNGFDAKNFNLNLKGNVDEIVYNNKSFQNIIVDGNFAKESFNGTLKIKDKNIDLDIDGDLDFGTKNPYYNLTAKIENIDLSAFGIDTTNQNIKGDFKVDLKGKDINEVIGFIDGKNVFIKRGQNNLEIGDLFISQTKENDDKKLVLNSDIVSLDILGKYKFEGIYTSLSYLFNQILPSYFYKPKKNNPLEDFKFNIDFKQPEKLTKIYASNILVSPFIANGNFNSIFQTVNLKTSFDYFRIDKWELNDVYLNVNKYENESLKLDLKVNELFDEKTFFLTDINLNVGVLSDLANFNLKAQDTGFHITLDANGNIIFEKEKTQFNFIKTEIGIDVKTWYLNSLASLIVVKNKYNFSNFKLNHFSESLSIDGEWSEIENEKLSINLNKFNLTDFNYLMLKKGYQKLSGVTNGFLNFKQIEKNKVLTTNLDVSNLGYGKDTLGNLSIETQGDVNSSYQNISVLMKGGALDSLKVVGSVDYKDQFNNLNLLASIKPTNLKFAESFLTGILSQIKGKFSMKDVRITGKFDEPVIDGEIFIDKTWAVVDYLEVPISFSSNVILQKNKIFTNNFDIFDRFGQKGKAKFELYHNNFKDMNMNLELFNMSNFFVMDIKKKPDAMFYGKGYADGKATIKGPFDNIDIIVDLKTRKGTHFIMPISEGVSVELPNYVYFKSNKKTNQIIVDESPINLLVLNIEATSDALVDIIFDETLDDRISGTGSGNLKMEMNKSGEFFMYGTYTVANGKYLFTAFDLYNKPFLIKPGGTVSWAGDPYQAKIDIAAFNSDRASPAPLLNAVNTSATTSPTTENITVESLLYLKGNLFTPEISFGLEFPKLQSELPQRVSDLRSVIARINTDKEEIARQVFSLLIMRSFMVPTFASYNASNVAGGNALSSAGSDLLSSQLSNWLNKIDPNWKINVIYKDGSAVLPTEYGVGLSKTINDRWSFEGSYSNYNTYVPNINLEYKVTPKGNFRIKAYSRSNLNVNNTSSLNNPNNNTFGLGIVYSKDYDKFIKKRKKKKKNKADETKG